VNKRSATLLFSVVFMDMVGFGFVIPLLPDYVTTFGGTPGLVGLLASVYALGQFIAAPIVGRLSDRYGRKPLLLLSIGGTFLSLLLLGAAWALPIVFLSRILDGLTGGNITIA
jgi:DHA1 family tetracycline resistance protein-like MFS transporter